MEKTLPLGWYAENISITLSIIFCLIWLGSFAARRAKAADELAGLAAARPASAVQASEKVVQTPTVSTANGPGRNRPADLVIRIADRIEVLPQERAFKAKQGTALNGSWQGSFSGVKLASAEIDTTPEVIAKPQKTASAPLGSMSPYNDQRAFQFESLPLSGSGRELLAATQSNGHSQPTNLVEELPAPSPKASGSDAPIVRARSIREITTEISLAGKLVPPEKALEADPLTERNFKRVTFTWAASATAHKPLYFEEPQLERYGHSTGPFSQPIVSAADFVVRLPLIPYMVGVHPLTENMYDLGDYRPDSCAPYFLDPFPLSVRGALFTTAAAVTIPIAF